MGISMLISLYTSRVILEILGIVDMGIYNVIGGITSSFLWLSGSLANSTQRYLNFEIGTKDKNRLNSVFNQSFWIYVLFAFVSLIVLETGGKWFIYNKLVIPVDRLSAALWVLHATSFTLAVTLLGSVYDAVLIARENMKIYAYIGFVDVILKLGIVYVLLLFSDRLKAYSILLCVVFVLSKLITVFYCNKKYSETKLKIYWNKTLVKEMFSFIGWNSVGTIVFILNNQGVDFLLNIFFGPVVNAAKAISNQVRNVVLNFSSNFLTAVRPQIVKKYSSNDIAQFLNLIFQSSKFLFFISWVIGFSLIIRINSILHYWLNNVPLYTNSFCCWILIFMMINVLSDPINCAFQAIGKQKKYILCGSSIYILAFPISYILFKYGYPPVSTFIILVIIRFIYVIGIVYILKEFVHYKFKDYISFVIVPIFKVVIISLMLILPINYLISDSLLGMFISIGMSSLISSIVIILFGLRPDEKTLIIGKLKKVFHIL